MTPHLLAAALWAALSPASPHPLSTRIAYTLIHSTWQAAAIAILLFLILLLTPRPAARLRYALGCFALALTFLSSLLTYAFLSAHTPSHPFPPNPAIQPLPLIAPAPFIPQIASSQPLPAIAISPTPHLTPWLSTLVLLWLLGVSLLALRHLIGWFHLQHLKHTQTTPLPPDLLTQAHHLATRLNIRRPITFLQSTLISTPAVISYLHPIILLPAALIGELTVPQLQSILAHELAHIRRHDYLVNLLQIAIETLFFYHPAIWWISHQIRRERENCCDDIAVSLTADRLLYARALTRLEELRCSAHSSLSPAITGPTLLSRIQRLLTPPTRRPIPLPAILLILLCLASCLYFTQRPTRAATLKKSAPATQPSSILPEDLIPDTTVPHLSAGDMVKLTLINPANPLARITHFIPITPDGNANFPTLGPLHLAGIPDDKATAAITQAYRNTSLQVTVELSKNSTNFEITGDTILMPGSRSLADKPNMRLTDALPLAGDLGSADGLIIYRNFPFPRQIKIDLQKLRAGDPSLNLLIRPHDALYFTSPPGSQPTAKFPQDPNPHIYLLGEPSISGVYDSPTKSTLGNLLAAHHLTPNTHFLTLLRRDGLHRTLLLKNIEIPAKKSLPDDIAQTPLQSNDTILITLIPLNTPAQLPDIIPSIHPNQIGEYYISGTALPGVFSITGRSITALQALAYAGGLDHPESSYTVSLRRRQTPDKESLPLNNIPLQNLLTGTSPDIELQRNDFLLFTPATTPSTHPAPSLHAESEPREDSDSSLHPSPGSLTPFNVERAIAPLQIPRKTTNTDQFVRDPSTGTPIPAHPLFQPATAPLHLSPAASEPNPRLQFRSVLADNDPAPAIILIDNSSSPGQTLRLSKTILFTESDIAHADATTPDSVTFHFKPDAGKRFSDYTASHINHRLAILFDGKLLLAPNINSRIGPSGVLTFPHQQAAQIASALNIAKSPSTHPSTAPHAESETREDSDSSLRPNSAILPSDLLPTTAPYRLTADDFLQITLPDPSNPATKITQSRRISPTGTITLPNLNPLPIANLTLTQAQAAIANAYQEKNLLPNPQISIHIIENNENTYIIIGDGVTRAGQYPIYGHSFRLTDALTRAGGASPSSLITIIRNSDDHTARRIKIAASSLLAGDPSLNVIIHSHDCISVTDPTRKYIQLLISRDALTLNGKTLPKDESQFNITLYMALRDAIPSADRPQTTLIVAADSDYIPLTRYLSILNIATACAESLHFLPTSSIGVLPDNPRSATLPHIGAQPSTTQLSSSKSIKDSPSSRPIIPLTGEYYITGLANRPGVYSLSNRSINLAQALLAAGTIPDSASFLNLIRRTDNTESILVNNAPIKDILASPQNFPSIQPDDILTLSAEKLPPLAHPQQLILPAPNPAPTGEVYVAGHIARPGVYSISGRSITLRQILISAGCTDSPAPTYIRITRRLDSTHESNLTLSLLNILTGTDPDLYLQPNDIINFTSTPPSKQSTPTAQ